MLALNDHFFHHYGAFGIFSLLALGIIALPVPDETLLLLAGALVKSQQLGPLSGWLAVTFGAIFGISISYVIGRTLGHFAFYRLCAKLKLSEKKLRSTQKTFKRIGPVLLFFGFFIPGVRHFTGVIAGTTATPYKRFSLFAYSGALLWSNLFFSLGYLYGLDAFNLLLFVYHQYGLWLLLFIILGIVLGFVLKKLIRKN